MAQLIKSTVQHVADNIKIIKQESELAKNSQLPHSVNAKAIEAMKQKVLVSISC